MELRYTLASYLDSARPGAMAENISDQLMALTSADVGTGQEENGRRGFIAGLPIRQQYP